jgi:hypothetical protein
MPATALIFSPLAMASAQIWIRSRPPAAPTIVAPTGLPLTTMTLAKAFGLPVAMARSLWCEVALRHEELVAMLLAGLRFGQADLRQFGVGIGGPGDVVGPRLGRQAEQHRADDDARVVARDMGELQPAGGIAHGIDPLVGGAQRGIDLDAAPVIIDARLFEVELVDIHLTAHGDQQVGAGEAAPVLGFDGDRAVAARHGGALAPSTISIPSARSFLQHHRGGLRVVLAQRLGAFDHRDLRPEAAMRLRHFHPDGTAADDDQVIGTLAQVEDRLVGVVGRVASPGIGGTKGREPVAMTKRRALMTCRRPAPRSRDESPIRGSP